LSFLGQVPAGLGAIVGRSLAGGGVPAILPPMSLWARAVVPG
jgi:hypothetical protein